MTDTRTEWQLFTSHGLVLISLLNTPGQTLREIGQELGLTERAVSLAIADLLADGYITRTKIGRRCFYDVNENQVLKYPRGINKPDHAPPVLSVKALRAENLATHAEHVPPKSKQSA